MSANFSIRNWVMALFVLGVFGFLPKQASANGDGYSDGGYRHYDPDAVAIARAYYLDPVNRKSSLIPEPVWRGMFPSIHERIMNEYRAFGTEGLVDREFRYWRRFR
jgi:hypothetical protein